MVLELAIIDIKTGANADFEYNLGLAQQVLQKAEGYLSHEFQRCIERENRYILLIKWISLEAHTIGFRTSELFVQWRGYIGQYFESPPQVEHFEIKFSGANEQ